MSTRNKLKLEIDEAFAGSVFDKTGAGEYIKRTTAAMEIMVYIGIGHEPFEVAVVAPRGEDIVKQFATSQDAFDFASSFVC